MNPVSSKETMLTLARSRIYAHLAACFRYPDKASWTEISGHEERTTFALACAELAEKKEYRPLRQHCGGLPLKKCGGLEDFQELCQEVFGHTISKHCPPYETEYGQMHLFQQSDFLADLSGFYRAFGVAPREGCERADHISLHLEFLYLVTFKEAHARKEGKIEEAEICHDAQTAFLEEHLGRWAPVFAKRLERKNPEGIYGAAARLLFDFIAAEMKALSAETGPVPDVARGELLPMAADEWDSSEWQSTDGHVLDAN